MAIRALGIPVRMESWSVKGVIGLLAGASTSVGTVT